MITITRFKISESGIKRAGGMVWLPSLGHEGYFMLVYNNSLSCIQKGAVGLLSQLTKARVGADGALLASGGS